MAKPEWLANPPDRRIKLKQLAAAGVSRKMIRAITGWSNNQMASFATNAAFSFDQYTAVAPEEMRKPLRDAGFDSDDIDASIAAVGTSTSVAPEKTTAKTVPKARKRPTQKRQRMLKAKVKKKARKRSRTATAKRSAKPAPAPKPTPSPAPAPVEVILTPIPETQDELATPAVTAEEVHESARAAIMAAAREASAEAVRPTSVSKPASRPQTQLPQRFTARVVDPSACRAPVTGPSLGSDAVCGRKPTVYMGCCEEHADRLFGKKWRNKVR